MAMLDFTNCNCKQKCICKAKNVVCNTSSGIDCLNFFMFFVFLSTQNNFSFGTFSLYFIFLDQNIIISKFILVKKVIKFRFHFKYFLNFWKLFEYNLFETFCGPKTSNILLDRCYLHMAWFAVLFTVFKRHNFFLCLSVYIYIYMGVHSPSS